MRKIIAPKLKRGDTVRIIAPSQSYAIISPDIRQIAEQRFKEMGLNLVFGKHIEEIDDFVSSSLTSRLEDFYEAFQDKKAKAVITVIGGFNCNQLLDYLDWNLIKKNPKIFCGFSDTTALQNALYAKTGLVTYSGPAFSTFGQKLHFDYTGDYFKKCFFSDEPYNIEPSQSWSDDCWWKEQDKRELISNDGWWIINQGQAEGTIVGANLCTFNLLQGTRYMPSLKNTVMFIEDDGDSTPQLFDRDLQSLIHQPEFKYVRGLVIGRFQKVSQMTKDKLKNIIKTKKELNNLPVVANVDFGHTSPIITFPIGGTVKIDIKSQVSTIKIIQH